MNHKILFVDLDATLLSDDKTVSEENRAAIQKMLLAGHDIVLSTGRPVESGRAVARELELTQPGCYMIAFNGAVLYDCAADRVLLKRSLPIEVTQELFERAAKAGIYAQTYNNTEIITTRHTAELEYYRKKTGLSYKLSANVLDLLEEEPQKVLMIDLKNTGCLARFREKNLEWEKGKCTRDVYKRQTHCCTMRRPRTRENCSTSGSETGSQSSAVIWRQRRMQKNLNRRSRHFTGNSESENWVCTRHSASDTQMTGHRLFRSPISRM